MSPFVNLKSICEGCGSFQSIEREYCDQCRIKMQLRLDKDQLMAVCLDCGHEAPIPSVLANGGDCVICSEPVLKP